jgi:hypothetical protein
MRQEIAALAAGCRFTNQGADMSSLLISGAASTAFPAVIFHSHRRGSKADSAGNSSVGQVGQLPVGVGQNLLSNLLQSLQQTLAGQTVTGTNGVGATTATGSSTTAAVSAATTTAPNTVVNPNVAQDLHSFLHALFQALRADGSSGGATPTATGTQASVTQAGSTQYQGGIASSLQTLIQQVSAGGTQTPATANLTATFNQLAQDLRDGSATTASSAPLQNFLNGFLQNLQNSGHVAPNLVGANVNAQV